MAVLGEWVFWALCLVRHEGNFKDGAPRKEAELILPLTGFELGKAQNQLSYPASSGCIAT